MIPKRTTFLPVALLCGLWATGAHAQTPVKPIPKPPTPAVGAPAPDAPKPVTPAPTAKANTPAAPVPDPDAVLPEAWAKTFKWRSLGPATMGGRITALSVYEKDPSIYWIATAGGGLLKTTNNGTTFEHQFDKESTVSIGDVCVAPSDPKIIYVGTGEAQPRNSVSYGDGVYKSVDGGKTWANVGLPKTFQIGKVLVHPTDPNTVYVGALGRLYGPNEDRGLYKTTDGGKTWSKILYKSERAGIIDMAFAPDDPNTLLAAVWERGGTASTATSASPAPQRVTTRMIRR